MQPLSQPPDVQPRPRVRHRTASEDEEEARDAARPGSVALAVTNLIGMLPALPILIMGDDEEEEEGKAALEEEEDGGHGASGQQPLEELATWHKTPPFLVASPPSQQPSTLALRRQRSSLSLSPVAAAGTSELGPGSDSAAPLGDVFNDDFISRLVSTTASALSTTVVAQPAEGPPGPGCTGTGSSSSGTSEGGQAVGWMSAHSPVPELGFEGAERRPWSAALDRSSSGGGGGSGGSSGSNGNLTVLKCAGTLPVSLETLLGVVAPPDIAGLPGWDSSLSSGRTLETLGCAHCINHLVFKTFTSLASPRELVQARSIRWMSDERGPFVLVAFRSVEHALAPVTSRAVRAECVQAGWVLRSVSGSPSCTTAGAGAANSSSGSSEDRLVGLNCNDCCHFSVTSLTDPKSFVPTSLINKFAGPKLLEFWKGVRGAVLAAAAAEAKAELSRAHSSGHQQGKASAADRGDTPSVLFTPVSQNQHNLLRELELRELKLRRNDKLGAATEDRKAPCLGSTAAAAAAGCLLAMGVVAVVIVVI